MSQLIEPLNSPVEVGLRALVLLGAGHPRIYDLGTMVLLDHALLHSGGLGGPTSLHPDVPNQAGELGIKRTVFESGIRVMARAGLVEISLTPDGIFYSATETGISFLDLLEADYVGRLMETAAWVIGHAMNGGLDTIRQQLSQTLGRWNEEFMQESRAAQDGEVTNP